MDIVLAYSGGLDTSVMIPWLKEHYSGKVIAMYTDVGQGEDVQRVHQKALDAGADEFVLVPMVDELVTYGLLPLLLSGAKYDGKYLLGTCVARSMQAAKQVEVAHAYCCGAVAHGGTAKGNDQIRFEMVYRMLAPELKVIAPWRVWKLYSREDAVDYAKQHGIILSENKNRFSEDVNIWNHTYDGDYLEDLSNSPDESIFRYSGLVQKTEIICIKYEQGIPVALNGMEMEVKKIIAKLNEVGTMHKIGRADIIENRITGLKIRSIYESPGASILYYAADELRSLVLDRKTGRFLNNCAQQYADLVYDGYFYSRYAEILRNLFYDIMHYATGEISLELGDGTIAVKKRSSKYSLYNAQEASYQMQKDFCVSSPNGFIDIVGSEMAREYQIHKNKEEQT